MKLIVAVVRDETVSALTDALTEAKIQVTKLASTGGFLKAGNTTFLMGVTAEQVPVALDLIRQSCPPRRSVRGDLTMAEGSLKGAGTQPRQRLPGEVELAGATVFVLNVEQLVKV